MVRREFDGERKPWLLTACGREGGQRGGGRTESVTPKGPARSLTDVKATPTSLDSNPGELRGLWGERANGRPDASFGGRDDLVPCLS